MERLEKEETVETLETVVKEITEEKMKTVKMLENRQEPMTVKELAKILGDSPSTIYRRIHHGEIEAFRDGWLIKIQPSAAVEWLKEMIAKGCPPRKRNGRTFPKALARHENPPTEGEATHLVREDNENRSG